MKFQEDELYLKNKPTVLIIWSFWAKKSESLNEINFEFCFLCDKIDFEKSYKTYLSIDIALVNLSLYSTMYVYDYMNIVLFLLNKFITWILEFSHCLFYFGYSMIHRHLHTLLYLICNPDISISLQGMKKYLI